MSKYKSISMHIQNWVNSIKLSVNEMMTDGQNDRQNDGMTDNPNLI